MLVVGVDQTTCDPVGRKWGGRGGRRLGVGGRRLGVGGGGEGGGGCGLLTMPVPPCPNLPPRCSL